MSESIFVNTWLEKRANLKNINSDLKDTQESANSKRASGLFGKVFWSLIALVNVLLFGDIFLNQGNGLINLFFLLIGGY